MIQYFKLKYVPIIFELDLEDPNEEDHPYNSYPEDEDGGYEDENDSDPYASVNGDEDDKYCKGGYNDDDNYFYERDDDEDDDDDDAGYHHGGQGMQDEENQGEDHFMAFFKKNFYK